jgi:acyl-ACP thioesterase
MSTCKPSSLSPLIEESSGGRKVRSNFVVGKSLPELTAHDAQSQDWQVRFADMDAVGHMNNASYWIAAEEYLSQHGELRAPMHAVVEHHLSVDPGNTIRIVTQDLDERVIIRHVLGDNSVAAVTQLTKLNH